MSCGASIRPPGFCCWCQTGRPGRDPCCLQGDRASEEAELITHPDILVIEDDVQLQTTIETALEDEGLQPAIAASGEEAVTLLKSDLSDYRALVVDIRLLGRIDGWEVARTARRVDPNLPVVYITGASAERWETQGVPSSVLLRKPFAPAELVTILRWLLDNGSSGEP